MIRVFYEYVDQKITKAYLKSLYTDTSLDNLLGKTCESKSFLEKQRLGTPSNGEKNIRKTLICLNDDDFTDETDAIDKRSRNMTSQHFEENPFTTTSNNEGDATSEPRKYIKRKKIGKGIDSSSPPDTTIRCFLYLRLLDFLSKN
jgi:hypothetical protein